MTSTHALFRMARPIRDLLAGALLFAAPAALADSHGLSAFGDLKYAPDFEHFDYVNPDAPKGGSMSTTSVRANQSFDTLNAYSLRGDPPMGLAAPENLVYDTLMARAGDEPDAVYSLVAESVDYEPGAHEITFEMRPEAEFADGTPVTAEDVVFTLNALKSEGAAPRFRIALANVIDAEALGPHRVRFRFDAEAPVRDLPMLVASLPILSEDWFEGRDFAEPTMDQPVGSGPYEVARADAGRSVTYRRRNDYWAKDLPVNVGRWNFDEITVEYFRDRTAALPALQAGELDLHESFSSKEWATGYDFDAIREGLVVKEELPDLSPSGTQGFWFNTRRDKFADPRVRQALAEVFDFEWSNRTLFYDLYERTDSFFEKAPQEATGEPTGAELALLEPFRDALPPEAFGPVYVPPVTDGSGRLRAQLRRSSELLDEAGWTLNERGERVSAEGERLAIEFIDDSSTWERVVNPYVENLKALGVDASFRLVDAAQQQRRQKEFDYDLAPARFSLSATPGVGLRNMYHSASADQTGSYNLSGVADPAVDSLVETMIAAEERASLDIAGRALDRALRAKHIWVPHWHKASHTIAYWDKFARPEAKPTYDRAILDTWWVDPEKEAALEERRGG